jgi:hypothetical protein
MMVPPCALSAVGVDLRGAESAEAAERRRPSFARDHEDRVVIHDDTSDVATSINVHERPNVETGTCRHGRRERTPW